MRNLVLGIVCSLVFSGSVMAAQAVPAERGTSTGLTPKDVVQLKEAAQGLRQVFGIEDKTAKSDQNPAQKQAGEEHPQKTMADVADKAVDMAGRMVGQAAEQIQKVAPDVWRIMIRQQYAKGLADVIVPLCLLGITFVYFKIARKHWKYEEESDGDLKTVSFLFVNLAPFLCGIALAIWTAIQISSSMMYLINPEFYAIRDMLMLLLNKGGT